MINDTTKNKLIIGLISAAIIFIPVAFIGCNRFNHLQNDNQAAVCTAECYSKCAKSCCSGEIFEGIFLGYTPEDYLICECWLYTMSKVGDVDADKTFKKRMGVIVRKTEEYAQEEIEK